MPCTMCGIVGVATCSGREPAVDAVAFDALRDRLAHRGPDGAGSWEHRADACVVRFGHRRLSVIDPSPTGAQPMLSASGTLALVYNGELYHDAELRLSLLTSDAPPTFRGSSDTETLAELLARDWTRALPRLRGMYALAALDLREQRLLLARDPLGIKPLYWTITPAGELVFASEIHAVLAHPGVSARPDPLGLSAYLTTIRTTTADRTLFEGVRILEPGAALEFDLRAGRPSPRVVAVPCPVSDPRASTRDVIADSVRRHLRSDVPLCTLLSGGLDSTIVATLAKKELPELWSYCAGAPSPAGEDDFDYARRVASHLGTRHREAPVTRELFAERWPALIASHGQPLSTPNEVAIHEVAKRLRADGQVVTLSGEGADELFAGYHSALDNSAAFEAGGVRTAHERALHQIDANAWIPREAKAAVLSPLLARATEGDAWLIDRATARFESLEAQGVRGLEAHLAYQEAVNLHGLLLRLDQSTMAAGVEGRTPLADAHVAAHARALPMSRKYRAPAEGLEPSARTKLALRDAFAGEVPTDVLARPKASFPLPFAQWAGAHASALESRFAREIFTDAACVTVAQQPEKLWQLAWPMINVALWGQRWWG
ncbi:MAG: asparagine synthase (glutamine-hydrolyzing) [Planctomycetota bacterium]|nr:asparagine synthase (glutamine-hydrolyzing) [Planctomycetota bacterium]